jgi:hypothetical protein
MGRAAIELSKIVIELWPKSVHCRTCNGNGWCPSEFHQEHSMYVEALCVTCHGTVHNTEGEGESGNGCPDCGRTGGPSIRPAIVVAWKKRLRKSCPCGNRSRERRKKEGG